MVFLTGLKETQLINLDVFVLNLLFEFSIEYDIQHIKDGYTQKKIEDKKNAPPDDEVMKLLGYK